MSRRCAACGQQFHPLPQVPDQTYCSAPECQRERRRRWQREKQRSDPDYRDNQMRSQKKWAQDHPDYWRQYRQTNPDYVERNREQQRLRNEKQRAPEIAKMDAPALPLSLPTGRYRLIPASHDDIAKRDEWIVEITVLSSPFRLFRDDCKDMT